MTAVVGLVVVAGSTVITAVSTWISAQQMAATHEQLRMMAAQQRPWLSVSVAPNSVHVTPLTDDAGFLDYSLTIKNTGQVAASQVSIRTELIERNEIQNPSKTKMGVDRTCMGPDYLENLDLTSAIFPGESITIDENKFISLSTDRGIIRSIGNKFYLTATVVGCAQYKFYIEKGDKHTPFAFDAVSPDWIRLTFGKGGPHPSFKAIPFVQGARVQLKQADTGNGHPD